MNKKLERLEKKFGVATSLAAEMTVVVDELPIQLLDTDKEEQVFSMESLKGDFILVRNSLLKVVSTGQRLLDTASIIDVSDLQANQLKALSDMQTTIGNNLKLLISIYKEITEIEKLRTKELKSIAPQNSTVNMGSVVNNQILFSGSSDELLDLIKNNQNI